MQTRKLADALDSQATASRALALSVDYYDETLAELKRVVDELQALMPALERRVAMLEGFAGAVRDAE